MPDVVVTGATGNVGTAVLRALRSDHRVGRLIGVARRLPDEPLIPGVEWVSADVAEDELEPVFRGADTLVHLAWRFQPTRDRRATWSSNVVGSLRAFDAARRAGLSSIVHASSIGAYSPFDGKEPDARVDERWPTHAIPTAAYGTQKSYLERALDAFELANPELRIVRIRSAFVFQVAAAPEQRRIFAGPLLPGRLVADGWLPILPLPRGLRLQTVHADDLAAAYAAVVLNPVSGAFNVAAEPIIRAAELGAVLRARPVELPQRLVRGGLTAAYAARLAPTEPGLLDLALSLPVMDTTRLRDQLGWEPRHTSIGALEAFLDGLRDPVGASTPPLDPHAGGPARIREVATGLGQRE